MGKIKTKVKFKKRLPSMDTRSPVSANQNKLSASHDKRISTIVRSRPPSLFTSDDDDLFAFRSFVSLTRDLPSYLFFSFLISFCLVLVELF